MKDFVGNEVQVGDTVICIEKGYNNLVKATVTKITPQNIKVKYPKWNSDYEVLRSRIQFVRIPDENL